MPLDYHEPDGAGTQYHTASDVDHLKTVLFVDYENARKNADRLFGDRLDNNGHFHPGELGRLVCEQYNKRPERRGLPPLKLSEVRVYRGLPDQQKESKRHADSLARKYAWLDGDMFDPVDSPKITVVDPPLHYPKASHPRWAARKAFEQEVDTQLTVDVLTMAVQGKFDVAVLFSEDQDFLPLMHAMLTRYSAELLPQIHRAGWCRRMSQADGRRKRQDLILDEKHHRLRHLGAEERSPIHKLWLNDYKEVADSANYLIGWDELDRCYTEDALVQGRVIGRSEDGLKVKVRGAVAFAPRNQLADADTRKYAQHTPLWFKVIEFDPKQSKAILSERAARKRTVTAELKKGDVVTGRISKIRSDGVFVKYGGVDWRVPNEEVSWSHDTAANDLFRVGQDVRVRVLAARVSSEDLRLSIRQAASQEWDAVVAQLRTAPFVIAEVVGVQSKKGVANARIEGTRIHGHVSASQLALGVDVNVDAVVEKGDLIPVKVLPIDRGRGGKGAAGRLDLSVVEARSDAEEAEWEFDDIGRVVHVGGSPDEARPSFRATDDDPEQQPKPDDAELSTAMEEALTRAGVEADRGELERE